MTSFLRKNQFTLLTANIILIYLVGISGILFSNNNEERLAFMLLTPANLLMNVLMLLTFHKIWNKNFVLSSIFIGIAGFIIEVLGVKTGCIFGDYHYGNSLGYKILDVPVMMAVNWFLLIYATAAMLADIKDDLLFSITGAAIITLLDVLIEPLCAYLHFWFWRGNVPFQNFVAWFIISFVLFYFFRKANGKLTNRYGIVVILIQFIFFGIINIQKQFFITH